MVRTSVHALDIAALEIVQRRVAQDLVAQVLGALARVEQERCVDHFADGFAQRFARGRQPLVRGSVAVSASRSSRSRAAPICCRMRLE